MPGKKKKDGRKINKDGLRKKPRLLKATVVSRDITPRKEMDEKLKHASDEWRKTFDAIPDLVMIVDREHRITRINRAVAQILNRDYGEILGKNCYQMMLGADTPPELCPIDKTRVEKKGQTLEISIEKFGKEFSVSTTPIVETDGEVNQVVVVMRDITERKRIAERLKLSEERYISVFNNSPDFIYINDVNGTFLDANPAVLKVLDVSIGELQKKGYLDFFAGDNQEELMRLADELRQGHPVYGLNLKTRNPQGKIIELEINAVPVYEDGRVVSVLSLARDITERKLMEKALRENENKFRSLFESSRDAIMTLDRGGFLDCNQATLNVFGCSSRDQFISKHPSELSPPIQADGKDSMTAAQERIEAAFSTGGQFFEWLHQRLDGTVFPAEVLLSRIEIGEKPLLQAMVRDITDRKRTEEKVRESGERFKNIFDNAGDGILIADVEKKTFLMGNKAICGMLGYNPEEISNLGVMDIHPEKDIPDVIAQFKKQTKGEITLARDLPVKRKDGTVLYADINSTIVSSAGKPYLMGFFHDNSERRRMENELRETRDYLEKLLGYANAPVIVWDPDRKITRFNRAFERMTGYAAEDVMGLDLEMLFAAESKESSLLKIDRTIKGENWETVEIPIQRKTGEVRWVLWNSANVYGEDGKTLLSTIAQGQDITERKQAEDKLRTFSLVVESSSDAIGMSTADGRHYYQNEAFDKIFGTVGEYPPDTLYTDKNVGREVFEALMRGEKWSGEVDMKGRAGNVHKILLRAYPIKDGAGKVTNLVGVHTDITDRKKTEELLRRSEESFRLISENASDFITMINREGVMLYASPSHRLLGYDPKEIVGKSTLDFVSAGDKEKITSMLQLLAQAEREDLIQIVKEGKSDRYVYGVDDKSGNIHYMESTANIIENHETGDFNVLFVSRDISERKKVEEALRRSEEQFRLISENSSDLIAVISMQGEYVYASPSHRKVGLEPGDLIGKSAFENIHPDDAEKVMEIGMKYMSAGHEELSRIAKKGANERINCRYIDGWGQVRHMQITGDLVQDVANQGFNILLVCRDVSETKKMEEELLKNEKLQSLSVLAGGIAHDFNNLLAAILGNVSVALSATDSKSEMHELLKDVETASRRAGGLVQQLLTFARGGSPVKKKMAIGQQLRDDVQMALSGSRVECEYSLPEDLWQVEVDPGQFRQAVSALVINAVQAMPEGGKIGVRAKNMKVGKEFGDNLSEGEYVKISFRDSGKGISPENLSKIFDPFFTTRPESSGLGLSAVYSIIKRHNGHITVDSTPGRGATFSVYLPARRENGREELKPGLPKANGAKRVLVMDDELMVQKVTGRMLTQIGYEVEFAKDGQEAIEIYQKARETSRPFAAVIMDLTIPGGMGGKTAVQKLIEIDPQVKAIVSSGYSEDPVMSDHRKYGFRGVIAKPYRYEEMAEVIKQVINE